jgi:hypothetical protein
MCHEDIQAVFEPALFFRQVIDSTFAFSDSVDAIVYQKKGIKNGGKVVIQIIKDK